MKQKTLQDSFSLVAYVDMQLVYGSWFVSLCKPRASAHKVLRDAYTRPENHRNQRQRRRHAAAPWPARAVHPPPSLRIPCRFI